MAAAIPESSNEEQSNVFSEEKSDSMKRVVHGTVLKKQLRKISLVVKNLEHSVMESKSIDKQASMTIQNDNVKNQRLANQLEEARKENKQLLNIIQQRCQEGDALSRSSSKTRISLSSCSSVSMVHLQYKHEELLASYQGLLKVLQSRVREIQNCHKENENLLEEMNKLKLELYEYENNLQIVCDKYTALKKRRDDKIRKLRAERDALKLGHGQLTKLQSEQCMEREKVLERVLQNSEDCDRALLLNEVRRTNKLQHQNTWLRRELLYLRARYGTQPVQNESITQ